MITKNGCLYELSGNAYSINITLVGVDELKSAKSIHNHPIPGDSFSKDDFAFLVSYKLNYLEVTVPNLGRFRVHYIGRDLSYAEASEMYEHALKAVQEIAWINDITIEYEQLETMKYLSSVNPTVKFERIDK